MTPEAWHGPQWLLCQAVAGQGHQMSPQSQGLWSKGGRASGVGGVCEVGGTEGLFRWLLSMQGAGIPASVPGHDKAIVC